MARLKVSDRQMELEQELERERAERKRLEEALRATEERLSAVEERLSTISDAAPVMIWMMSAGKITNYFNKGWLDFTGWTPEQSNGKGWIESIHRDDLQSYLDTCVEAFEVHKGFKTEYRLRRADGEFRWILDTGKPRFNDDGSLAGYVGTCIDITERKQMEEALRRSEVYFRSLIENALDLITILDPDGTIRYESPSIERLFGYKPDELVGRSAFEFVHPDDVDRVGAIFLHALENRIPTLSLEFRFLHKSGEWKILEATGNNLIDNPIVAGVVVNSREVSERKRMEYALKQSEKDYRGLFENAHDAIIILSLDREIVLDVNQRACELYGFSREEFVGMSMESISENNERGRHLLSLTIEKGTQSNFETVQFRKDGSTMILEINATVIDYQGKTAILSVNRDITERKRAEEVLRETNQTLQALIQASPLAITAVDTAGRVKMWNRAAERMFGWSESEVLGLPLPIAPDEAEENAQRSRALSRRDPTFTGVRTSGQRRDQVLLETRRKRRDGSYVDVSISTAPLQDAYGNLSGVMAVMADISERKRAEEALRKSEEKYRNLFENMPIGIYRTTPDGHILMANPSLVEMLGYSSFEQLSARNLEREGCEPTYPRSQFKELLEQQGEVTGLEAAWIKHDGSIMFVRENAKAIRSEDGKVLYYEGTVENITERKRAEEALRESEKRFRSLVEQAADAFFVQDMDGNLTDVNQRACDSLGYTREELLALNVEKIEAHSETGGLTGSWRMMLPGHPVTVYGAHRRKDGTTFPVEMRLGLIESGGRKFILSLVRDITERKRAEMEQAKLQAAVRMAATEWRLTIDAVNSPILILDLDGKISRLNRSAKELSGYSYIEILGRKIETIGAGQPWQKIAELAHQVRGMRVPKTIQTRDEASGRIWDVTARLFTGPSVNDERIIVVAHDITKLEELQASLRRSETMSAMGSLVAGVAHEVRNPLFGISATLDAFEARFGTLEGYDRYTKVLRREVNRMSELMRTLLEYGRPAKLELVPGPIEEVITQSMHSCQPLAEKLNARLESSIDSGLPLVAMERGRLLQVFQNLLENAIQHTPAGASVKITAGQVEQEGELWIECSVRDEGPGFQPEDYQKIFEPFYTKRRGGTGLGLSIVQRIVEEHRGRIIADNAPEGGALMKVFLPVITEK